MEKLTQETVNFTEKNIDRIAALFPSVYFGLIGFFVKFGAKK